MTIRFKILAATLGLALASGAIADAFAQSNPAPAASTAQAATSTTVAPTIPKSTKSAALKSHRRHVAQHAIAHKMAHRVIARIKVAKRYVAKTHLAKAQPIVAQKHAMASKTSVIR